MCERHVLAKHTFEEPKLDVFLNKIYLRVPDMAQLSLCHDGVFVFRDLS